KNTYYVDERSESLVIDYVDIMKGIAMAVDLTLLNSNSLNNIEANFERVQTALEDAVSRSGTVPNQMNADLDMNRNDLLNIGTIQAQDITIDGGSVTGVIARAEDAAAIAIGASVEAEGFRDEAEIFRDEAEGFASGLNLPLIEPGDA